MRYFKTFSAALGVFLAAFMITTFAQQQGGAFIPTADYTLTGTWTFSKIPVFSSQTSCDISVTSTGASICTALTGTGLSVQQTSPTIITPLLTSPNLQQAVTASASATPTLTAAQCGGIFAWDRASGTNYTLPVPVVGCTFDFINTVAQTSLTNEVQTSGASVFIQGGPAVSGTTTQQFVCNGSSHVAIKTNDTTTGGLLGGHVKFTALTTTLWQLDGTLVGSGTVATPCTATP